MEVRRLTTEHTLQVAGRQLPDRSRRRRPFRAEDGSFSVEAAAVFPLFMVLLAAFLRMIPIYALELSLQRTMSEDGAAAALAAAALPENEEKEAVAEAAGAFISAAALAAHLEALYGSMAERAGVTGGFYTGHCRVRADEVDLSVVINVRVFGLPEDIGTVRVVTRSVHRTFAGVSLATDEEDDETVYVTQSGTVYHRSMSCPYIQAAVQYCPAGQLASARNRSGEIYRRCERCCPSDADGGYYVTPYGVRYHSTETCSYLLHTVTAMPKSEAAEKLRPCPKCGGSP